MTINIMKLKISQTKTPYPQLKNIKDQEIFNGATYEETQYIRTTYNTNSR